MQVEPQEKKKTPKGRAKKRITYTRRFVNVTMTGGKRKVSLLLFILGFVVGWMGEDDVGGEWKVSLTRSMADVYVCR